MSACPTCGRGLPDKTTLGGFLRARRDELGWTLREVEEQSGGVVSNPLLSQVETGRVACPRPATLIMLSALYGLEMSRLLQLAAGFPYEADLTADDMAARLSPATTPLQVQEGG